MTTWAHFNRPSKGSVEAASPGADQTLTSVDSSRWPPWPTLFEVVLLGILTLSQGDAFLGMHFYMQKGYCNYRRFAPAIHKGIIQVVDLGGGSWNQERDGNTQGARA